MKVALANSSRIWGGAEVMTARLARGLVSRGHEVVVLCRPGSPFIERLAGVVPCEPTLGGFDMNPVAVVRTLRTLRRRRPDVMMTMTQKDPRTAGPAARIAGVPVVVRHAMDVPFLPRLRHRLYYGWIPTLFVANSLATRDTMLGSAPWLRAGDIEVIYNGIDLARIDEATPADLALPDDAIAIGYVARFEERKGIRELISAWPSISRSVPRAHLVLVGHGGDLERAMRDESASLDRVHWLGFREDVPGVMKSLDMLVAPSHYEGFGLVVAEAMATGTAVAVARASNFPELVADGVEGRHFEVRDPASLARVVTEMALDPDARRAMGEAGRRRARSDFSLPRMMDEYEELLLRVAGSRAAHRRDAAPPARRREPPGGAGG